MVKIDMDAIRRLSVPERVRLVQDIWDTLQPTAEDLPLTSAQREVIDRRLAEHQADPSSAIPWEEVRARLESRLKPR
jgi:putative addiction module component (TIGR02574 family)